MSSVSLPCRTLPALMTVISPFASSAATCVRHAARASILRAPSSRTLSTTPPRCQRFLQTAAAYQPSTLSGAPPPRVAENRSSLSVPLPTSNPPSKPTASQRPRLRARKAALTLTPRAVSQVKRLLALPEPKLLRVGVKNRGCSGLAYHLEYVDKPGKFDEEVVQDGVRVLIDSKALFSIIGSEMDWVTDRLSERFVFRNPNIKEQCGCGESFNVVQ